MILSVRVERSFPHGRDILSRRNIHLFVFFFFCQLVSTGCLWHPAPYPIQSTVLCVGLYGGGGGGVVVVAYLLISFDKKLLSLRQSDCLSSSYLSLWHRMLFLLQFFLCREFSFLRFDIVSVSVQHIVWCVSDQHRTVRSKSAVNKSTRIASDRK